MVSYKGKASDSPKAIPYKIALRWAIIEVQLMQAESLSVHSWWTIGWRSTEMPKGNTIGERGVRTPKRTQYSEFDRQRVGQ